MGLVYVLLEDFVDDKGDCVFVDAEISNVLKFGHFFDFQPTDHSYYLIQTFFSSFDGFFDAKFPASYASFDVALDFFEENFKQIAVPLTLAQYILMSHWHFLQIGDVNFFQLVPHFLTVESANQVGEDKVGTLQTSPFHDG